ncbi:uncharacterized protein LOC112493764 [Cephus cinctus]|uniref:Uncharacterized protein LOC112493764 n=1 Tax=Cephus cinctus TaxID=211228 RepID=A0AAJ7R978_CEPCN|nr:uncharacterized protein LOC112493764 [Cephus cinctus]
MTCAPETCNIRHAIQETHRDIQLSRREFIKDLLHLKCKVIHLVQDQIKVSNGKLEIHYQKGNRRGIEMSTTPRYFLNSTKTARSDEWTNSLTVPSTSTQADLPYMKHVAHLPPEHRMNNRTWKNSISRLIPHCSNILLAALILGILVWMSLLYGALLGASLCGHGRSSFPLMSFAHSQTRNILF